MLLDAGATNNWQAHRVEAVSVDGERASSSTLRDALARGNLRRAESLMGRLYTLCGHVIHGKKLGRGLGFPTLNIPVDDQLVVSGVFAVRVRGLGSSPIAGVASLGRRPTTESQGRLLLEVHLFDWSGEAYGRVVEVIFHEKLRDEIYYTSVDAMTQQIERDAHAARHYLNDHVH
jgi:riboflavin kinase/FMN adenylyltransferase